MGKGVYSVTEVAKIIHVSIATVNRLLNSGKLQGYQPSANANWKIPRKELLRYMREQKIPLDFLGDEKTRILVIDDEEPITALIKTAFAEEKDVEVETAHSGFQAGLKLESFRPDVILLDIYLGDMDGHELLEHIRSHSELQNARVIGMSGILKPDESEGGKERGFDAFLQKPFQLSVLKSMILNAGE